MPRLPRSVPDPENEKRFSFLPLIEKVEKGKKILKGENWVGSTFSFLTGVSGYLIKEG